MKQEYINILLERYLDGETTNQEEQQLSQYFATATDVPAEWRVYRAMFAYTASQQQAVARTAGQTAANDGAATAAPTVHLRVRQAVRWLAAACVAAVVMLSVGRRAVPSCYAVIDGRVVTSQQRVLQEAEDALMMVSYSDDDTFDALDMM